MKNIHEIMSLLENDSFWELCNTHSADPELLRKFTDKYDLPEDYLDLLNITDGFKLFHAGDYTMRNIMTAGARTSWRLAILWTMYC